MVSAFPAPQNLRRAGKASKPVEVAVWRLRVFSTSIAAVAAAKLVSLSLKKQAAFEFIRSVVEEDPEQEWDTL